MSPNPPPPPTPPHGRHLIVDTSNPHILILTLSRPKQYNSMNDALQNDLRSVLDWFEGETSLWVCIVTGAGEKAFCAGQDLKEWLSRESQPVEQREKEHHTDRIISNPYGFGSLSRRASRKPIIAGLNGDALGGGAEIVVNCDLVVAREGARIGFPEVSIGVVAAQGAIPRLSRICGHIRASEMLLLGRPITVEEGRDRFGIVNRVVPTANDVLPTCLELARTIISNSPDAVQVTKLGLLDAWRGRDSGPKESLELEGDDVESSTVRGVLIPESVELYKGRNFEEGLRSFTEKRRPKWTDPPNPPKAASKGRAKL